MLTTFEDMDRLVDDGRVEVVQSPIGMLSAESFDLAKENEMVDDNDMTGVQIHCRESPRASSSLMEIDTSEAIPIPNTISPHSPLPAESARPTIAKRPRLSIANG